ncbi:MAG: molybdopterin molybdotransferase MoeA [Actinomycetota bacterium]
MTMLSLDEAKKRVVDRIAKLEPGPVPLADAAGLILAADVTAPHDLPRFDNSAMDGYAVRAADVENVPATLHLAGEVRAGQKEQPHVEPGTAVRIMTGAPLPPGADAIVPVEVTEETAETVTVNAPATRGDHVRPAGGDMRAGDVAVAAGSELTAGELAVLASVGAATVTAYPRPRVALLVTGDEIVDVSETPGPGQIRDSNSLALKTLIADAGADVTFHERVTDDLDAAFEAFERAAERADLIVSSGGVSMGRYDYVKDVVEKLGHIDLWRVAMKPGKPVVFGDVKDVPFLGLPGNPVSVHVGFEQFVRPAIRKLRGCARLFRPLLSARLTDVIERRPGRFELIRVRLARTADGWAATPTATSQASHIQSSLVDTHGLARIDADLERVDAGTELEIEVWKLPETAE